MKDRYIEPKSIWFKCCQYTVVYLHFSHTRDKFVSLLNCFSAGVFCATFFMHMMPEVSKNASYIEYIAVLKK